MKTSELTGAALDWAVAKCEGEDYSPVPTFSGFGLKYPATNYSTNWAQGGRIIERERISIIRLEDDSATYENGDYCGRTPAYGAVIDEYFGEDQLRSSYGEAWGEIVYIGYELVTKGQTPLIAAMRCYVASKLGDDVEIPEELTC